MKLGDTRETTVDVRFVFATNAHLKKDVEGARFRRDLFFRINAFTITLPPLRERKDDILLLANHFLAKSRINGTKHLSPGARHLLEAYKWPGNVRELANVIERAVLLSGARGEIRATDFPEDMTNSISPGKMVSTRDNDDFLSLESFEQQYIEKVLQAVGNNKSKAARILSIGRARLYSKINKSSS
jgi:two-component system NtrC family response regulator